MRKVIKILAIIFAALTLIFSILELLNIFNSNYYTLTLGLVSICESFNTDDKTFKIISLVLGILLIISFIIYII